LVAGGVRRKRLVSIKSKFSNRISERIQPTPFLTAIAILYYVPGKTKGKRRPGFITK